MQLLFDENVPRQLVEAIRAFMRNHQCDHVIDKSWSGTKDLDLYPRAAEHGYQAVVTNDVKQMKRQLEVEAIAKSGLHRIEYRQKHPGLEGLGLAIGTVSAALPLAVKELEQAAGQLMIQLRAVNPGSRERLKIINPRTDPPAFWPSSKDV
ncbi:DUF5615 family PIN-like protein [Glycomyces buryatensis]|uniref:VapC45 PIN like domain-containing protein n=1 Tax=Glycomyces buryatensis TaxID=2570927 RepID=A0A4S8QCA1_9ACTN|nr:DUF5615 family PIN-like protein [Glycomyces buryatensis]THV40592.1 hypothetical protein FAB82_15110 [Glycomyces buryatensis]